METAVTKLVIVAFLVVGISHIAQPRIWAQFFIDIRGRGEPGIFQIAFLNLPLGALIVSFHNVWSGLPLALTLIGWAFVLKSFVYFVFPAHGMKMLSRVSIERLAGFVAAGVLMVGVAGWLAFSLLRA